MAQILPVGASASCVLPIGATLNVTGSGVVRVREPGKAERQLVVTGGAQAFGPYAAEVRFDLVGNAGGVTFDIVRNASAAGTLGPVVFITGVSGLNQEARANLGTGWTASGWQWFRRGPSGSEAAIAGATSDTYMQQAADVVPGTTITARASGLSYTPPGLVADGTSGGGANAAPQNTAVPTISGTAQVGSTLTSTTGSWSGNPAPTFTRQWLRNGAAIPGAAGASYVPTTDDLGATIALRVTAANSEGSAAATSAATAPVIAAGGGNVAPSNSSVPTIAGTAQVGQTLSSTVGSWSGTPTPTYARQWLRNGVAISGANAATYVPVTGDIGATISLRVTATNSEGSAQATSAATAAVAAAPADTRPRFFYAAANPSGTASIFNDAWASATPLNGSSNGGRSGTFQTVADSTKYTWLAIPLSAFGSGITVHDGVGPGGFSGALSTGLYSGTDANPTSVKVDWTAPDGTAYALLRSNGRASNSPVLTVS